MTRQDNLVQELRAELDGLSCPSCGNGGLRLILHCDYYPDGCLWLAGCDCCKVQYHINQASAIGPGGRNRLLQSAGERNPSGSAV